MSYMPLVMLAVAIALLLIGYPVAFTLGATAAGFGIAFLGIGFLDLLPLRIWGIMTNFTLLAVPLFVFMGVVLEKSGLAEDLLETMGLLFGRVRGGLAIAIVVVGALLAATTGVAGATVVTMGIIALPAMLKHGYRTELATGTIAASGTLGQVIPPSIILILLGDVMGVPVGKLFVAAVTPGLLLIVLFMAYIFFVARRHPQWAPAIDPEQVDGSGNLALRVVTSLLQAPQFDPGRCTVLLCGPEVMLRHAIRSLQALGVADAHMYVSLERNMQCAVGTCGHCQLGPYLLCRDGAVFAYPAVAGLMRVTEL